MSKEKSLFWLGVGVICIGSVDYGAEMPLPTEKIKESDLKKMLKDGRIGEKIAPVDNSLKALLAERDRKISDLGAQLDECHRKIAAFEALPEKKGGKK